MSHRFMNGPTFGGQANVQASEIAFSIFTSVAAEFFDVLYPDYDWRNVLLQEQIISEVSPGAISYGYMSRDMQGRAAYTANIAGDNIPLVGQSAGAVTVPLAVSMIGAKITNEDARQYAFGFNATLSSDLTEVMMKGSENLTESSFFFGDTSIGFLPWLDYPNITKGTAAATGTAGGTTWASKVGNPSLMVADVNNAITAQWSVTRGLFKLGSLFLPFSQFSLLANTPMVLGGVQLNVTAMAFLKENNLYTQLTGKPLVIMPLRYLTGVGGGPSDRLVLSDRNRQNQCMPFPIPYTPLPPVPGAASTLFVAENKTGSYHVRRTQSMYYLDGI